MKSQNLGSPLKYSGEWDKNLIKLEQSITQNDKFIKISTSLPKQFYNEQLLTLWIAGINMTCVYKSENQIMILSTDNTFTTIQKDATVYVLRNFEAERSEELVTKSELNRLHRNLMKLNEVGFYNQQQMLNIISYVGEITSLEDTEKCSFGDVAKYDGKFYVFSKIMLSCVIEKVTTSELTITSLGDAQRYLSSVIVGDTTVKLKFKSQDTERMATYTYESSVIPSVSDVIYVPMWQQLYLPVKLLKLIVEGIS